MAIRSAGDEAYALRPATAGRRLIAGLMLSLAALALGRGVCAQPGADGQTTSAAASMADPAGDTPTESQVQAVFVFNFAHFVQWPGEVWRAPAQPFVIGVLGDDPLMPELRQAVSGERIGMHPLAVRQITDLSQLDDCCQILFIDRSVGAQLGQILQALDHHSTLTVSNMTGASQRGVMVQFVKQDREIHLLINEGSARAAGLTISSNLLRLARIVHTARGA